MISLVPHTNASSRISTTFFVPKAPSTACTGALHSPVSLSFSSLHSSASSLTKLSVVILLLAVSLTSSVACFRAYRTGAVVLGTYVIGCWTISAASKCRCSGRPSGMSCGKAFRVGCTPDEIVSEYFSTVRPLASEKFDPVIVSPIVLPQPVIRRGAASCHPIFRQWAFSTGIHLLAIALAHPGQYGAAILVPSDPFSAFPRSLI